MNKKLLLLIPVLILLIIPFTLALTDDEINALVDSIVFYSHQTDSCTNTTTDITGTAGGTPTPQDIAGDITGSCDYDTSDSVAWDTNIGPLDSMINFTHLIYTNEQDSGATVKTILTRGTSPGGMRWEKTNGVGQYGVTYQLASGTIQFSPFDHTIRSNTGFKILIFRVNVTGSKVDMAFMHNKTIVQEGTSNAGAVSTSVAPTLNARGGGGFAGDRDYAAYIIFNKSVSVEESEYINEEFVAGRHLELIAPPETTPPVIQIGINNTSPKVNEYINISFNVTDDTAPTVGNLTINWTTGTTITNFTISADSDLHNVTQIIDTRGNVLNFSVCFRDAEDNYACNSTIITIADTLPTVPTGDTLIPNNPVITDTLEGGCSGSSDADSDPIIFHFQFFDITDSDIRQAFSTDNTYPLVSPTDSHDQFRVDCRAVTDFGNSPTDRTGTDLETVQDSLMSINSSFNISFDNSFINDWLNISFNITDIDGLLSANITINFSGTEQWIANFTLSGTEATVFNVTQFASGGVFNITGYGSDAGGFTTQNSTLITIIDNVLPIVNQTSNSTLDHLHINDFINFSCNATDETALFSGNITNNMTGAIVYNNFTLTGTEAIFANATEITVVGESTINVTCFVTDESNNVRQNSTIYEVRNTNPTTPTIILPINDDYNNTQPGYQFNVTFAEDVDGDPLMIYYYIDGVLNQTSTTNTTFNASDGHYKLNVSIMDIHGDSSPNASVNFTIDTTIPTLLVFNLTNNTVIGFNVNLTLNITVQDINPFNLSFNVHNSSDDRIFFGYNDEKNSSITLMIVETLNVSALGSGNYTIDINFSDRHTKTAIKDYEISNVYTGINFFKATGLNFRTAEGSDITIKQTEGNQEASVKYTKLIDRYTISYGTIKERETRVYIIISDQKIQIIKGTRYKGHLIIGKNWMDFENGDSGSIVTIRRISDNQVEVTVFSTNFNFNSIGGLNVVDVFYNFQVDNHAPNFPSQSISDVRPDSGDTIELSHQCADGIKLSFCWLAHNQSGVWINATNTSFDVSTFLFNLSLSLPITATAGTVIGTEGYANDSFNEFGSSGVFTLTVNDTTVPEVNVTFNTTFFHVNQSINITVNSSDNFELAEGIITVAEAGLIRFFNFSLESTASNTFHQNITIPNNLQGTVNITVTVNDTFGNSATNFTILEITKDLIVTARNVHGNTTINSFTAILTNSTFTETQSTTTGEIVFAEIVTGLFDITIRSEENGSYINRTIIDINSTDNFVGNMYQTITYFTAIRRGTGISVLDFRVEAPLTDNQSNSTGGARLFLNATNYEIGSFSDDYFDIITRINVTSTLQSDVVIEFFDINLSINIFSISNNSFLNNFDVTLIGNDSSFSETLQSKSDGSTSFNGNVTFNLGNGTYEVIVDAEGHALFSERITLLSNETLQNITFSIIAADSINFTIFDEILDIPIDRNATLIIVSDEFATNITLSGSNFFIQDLVPGDYRFTYVADTYTKRDFFGSVLNTTNQSIKLYLLSTANGTDVDFKVQDNSGNKLVNATIRLKRYYVSTNSYRTVAMSQTNQEGKALIDVDFNDAFYETLTTFKEFSLRTTGAKIITTTFILTMRLTPDPLESVDTLNNMITTLTFNNLTETFSYVFTDIAGVARTGNLVVIEITPTSETILCTSTDTSPSATLLCQVNTTNLTGSFIAKGSIQVGDNQIVTNRFDRAVGELKQQLRDIISNQGIFLSILVAGTLGGLGAAVSPAVGIIMFLVGLTMTAFFGLNIIIVPLLVSFIILGGIIIYKMKSR